MRHIRTKVEELNRTQQAGTQQEDDHVFVRSTRNLNSANHEVQDDHLFYGQISFDELSCPGEQAWVAAVKIWILLL